MAEAKLGLSLDDIISRNVKKPAKAKSGGGRGSGGRGAGGRGDRFGSSTRGGSGAKARALGVAVGRSTKRTAAPRRVSDGGSRRIDIDMEPVSRSDPKRPRLDVAKVRAALEGNARWQHDKFEELGGGRPATRRRAPMESGHKLVISNLDYKVSDDDIRELFETIGPIKRGNIVYDNSGRSEEMAEVVFVNKADALAAIKRYNNVSLDGKAMRIELASSDSAGGRTVETLSSGIRVGGRGAGRASAASRVGSGNLRSAQPSKPRRAQGRLGGRGNRNADFMEE